jgi:hypothetical protein
MLHRYLALRRWPEGKRVVLDFAALMADLIEPVFAGDVVRVCDLATGTQRNLEPDWPRTTCCTRQ